MTFKQIREEKIDEMKHRIFNEMYTNYSGEEMIQVDNITTGDGGIAAQVFNTKELELIDNEKILHLIEEEGWEIRTIRPRIYDNPFNIKWVFKPIKKD